MFKEGPEQVSKFKALREHSIEVIKAAEDPTVFIVWKDTRAKLDHLMDDSIVWEAPKDQYWPVDEYMRTKGMPETNGLGHRRGKDLNGKDCVIVPESCFMTRYRQVKDTKRLKRTLDDGSANLSQDQVHNKWKAMQGCSLMDGEGIDGRAIMSGQGQTMQALLGLGLFSGPGVAPRNQGIQYGNQQPPIVQTPPSSSKQFSQSSPVDFGDAFVPVFDLGNDKGTSEIGAGATGQRVSHGVWPSGTLKLGGRRGQPTGTGSTADPKALPKRLGRPPRDVAVLVRQTIDSFESCSSDEKDSEHRLFFGDASDRQKGYLSKLQKDFEEWVKKSEDEENIEMHLQDQKKLKAIITITTAFKKHKRHPQEFQKQFQSIRQFLESDPPLELQMPAVIICAEYEATLQEANEHDFWVYLQTEKMSVAGFKDIPQKQERFTIEAVATLVQCPSYDDAAKSLYDFCFALDSSLSGGLAANIVEQISWIGKVVKVPI